MKVCREEVFGPVVTIRPYETFEDALKTVNDSKYGLQAGVFTNDIERAFEAHRTWRSAASSSTTSPRSAPIRCRTAAPRSRASAGKG